MEIIERLKEAIKKDKFAWKKYLCGGYYWGEYIETMPLHCSYGLIGYTVTINHKQAITYDWELDKMTF